MNTSAILSENQTIVALFSHQAKATPQNIAVVYKDKHYTYAEVDEISDRIAGYIASKGLGLEDVVSILIPRCEWMAIASLGVLKAGCAYQPLDPTYPKERLNFMMQDASAKLLISLTPAPSPNGEGSEWLAGLDYIEEAGIPVFDLADVDTLPKVTTPLSLGEGLGGEALFILLYTSGSTGVPKGCQLEHRNLVTFCDWYRRYYDLQPGDHVAAYASYGFDACMMDMYPALTTGAAVYIIPEEIRLDLIALNDYFEANQITHAFMTTQVGCQFAEMDNHSLKHLSVGGESFIPVEPPTNFQLYNVYGPTECTIFTTAYPIRQFEKNAPIGKPLDSFRLYVVDQQGQLVENGQEGELWISGPQVARGYLNRPEQNAQAFTPNPFCQEPYYDRVYHTGDIVRWLPDGNLQFIGRRDGQVKIRGFRIEMREVESVIKEFPGIKDVTVQAFDEDGGGKFIAAYIVSDEQVDVEALNNFIIERKPPYMVPAATMQIERIPLNQNQKVDKRALPKPEKTASVGMQLTPPQNELQRELVEMIGKIIHNTEFGIDTPLRYVGLTSISAIRLAATAYKQYGVALDAKNLVKEATVLMIEEAINGTTATAQKLVEEVTVAPLSFSQTGVYVDCINNPKDTQYNIPWVLGFPADTDTEQLRKAVLTVLEAHQHIFVHFEADDDDIVQRYAPTTIDIPVLNYTDAQLAEHKKAFVRPFDLSKDVLCRMEIAKTESGVFLLLDIHHLVFDGSSLDLFIVQLCEAMEGKSVETETYTHLNHAADEQTESTEAHKAYYDQLLGACEGATELPPDLPTTFECEKSSELYRPIDLEAVEQFCREHPVTPAHLTLAATLLVFARFTGNNELFISTVSSGRSNIRIQNTFGMFVNTLPLTAKLTDGSVMDFIKEVSESFDEAMRHEQYPFARIAADYGYTPELAFAYQLGMVTRYMQNGHEVSIESLEAGAPKFPLIVRLEIHDGQPSIVTEYDNGKYSESLVAQLTESVVNVLKTFINQPQARLLDISLLSAEQTQLLDSFNDNDVPYDDTQTIVSLFRQQAQKTPENIAVVYKETRLTYRQVDEMSDRIAGYVASKGLGIEDVVSVLIPRCEWMPIVSLGVMKAGCAYQPLDPTYPKDRLNFMMKDANAKLLIADEALLPIVDEYQGDVVLTKELAGLPAVSQLPEGPKPDSLFILLYTSGSTGVPKGCQLIHSNLVAFIHWYHRYYDLQETDKITAYASYGFDANMYDTYPALTRGASLYIIPEEIRLDLIALNEYFEREGITNAFMTTQVAYQFVTTIENHSLKHFSTGGEKLASLEPPKGYKLHNAYGPTETTILETIYQVDEKQKNIPIGKAIDNMHLYIVDAQGHRLPAGAVGELWANGPQVGRGYLNRPDKTAESFVESPWGRCYRTGDVVRYLPDGNIQFVGRQDGQVKIRGFRIELKEVEAVIREFPGIKDVTVQAFDENGGGKFIAAYIVSDEQVDIEALNNFILDQKPPYMVPAVTMQIEAIPLNQNQKVDKRALPKPEKQATATQVSNVPMNVLEQELHKLIAGIVNNTDFGITTILGYAGLTSISAIKVATQIYKRFGVQLDAKLLTKVATIQTIENEILTAMLSGSATTTPSKPVVGHDSQSDSSPATMDSPDKTASSSPLSYAQTGVYFDCMKNPTSTLYNTPIRLTFPIETDTEALKKAAVQAVENHPALFVQFTTDETGIVQVMGDRETPVEVEDYTMSEEEALAFRHGFVRPFNLAKDRLFRLATIRTEKALYLYCDIHHLVCDGYSYDLFIHEICDLMDGKEIEPEMCSYHQFVAEQKAAEKDKAFAEAAAFFKQRLGEVEEVTELAPDLTNPRPQGENGRVCAPIVWDDAEQLAKQQGVKPSVVLLSAVFYSLARFSGNDQVCITTISNGRSNLKVANTMGMFVNTLALSSKIGSQSVQEFLHESANTFEQTLAHENYPFARVAADFDLKADIMFAYQMGVLSDYRVGGKKVLTNAIMELNVPKFKIAFYITDEGGGPVVAVEYDNGQYSEAMMQSLAQSVSNAVSAFAAAADKPLRSISLTDNTGISLLDSFNETAVPYDNTQTIVSLFRRQVAETPDNLAVVYHDIRLTYKEVDEKTDAIAALIQSKVGSGKENVVSILIGRGEWMVQASLGVLKAGCAYQPLDPSYPSERLNFMMQDANAKLLIAEEALLEKVSEYQGPVLLTKDLTDLSGVPHPVTVKPEDLFILLYTSGSTGNPKGCQLEHRNLVAFCHWFVRYYGLKPGDKVAAYASYGFDACMMDMYPALTTGAAVVIVGDDIRLNLPDLNAYFNEEGVTHSFMTTQVGCQFAMNCDNHSLRHLSVGGEKILPLTPPTAYQLHNGYGPTECTIFTTTYALKEFEQNAPIGKPLDNLQLFIVDKDMNRLPLGAAGEMLVSGPQVSRGYLNLPEKTADTYINWNGKRCYRTGDVVRYLADGNIQFVGRRDGQVKIRGFRIELKEVESVIREFLGIGDATVQAFDYPNGGKFIAAYVVSDQQIDIQALNAFIRDRKPPYMVPAATMQIPSIPLNQNQKVNRRALPAPQIQVEEHDYVAPVGDVETLFCDIFAGVLSLDKVGATDNFFEMGGTSLMVTKVIIEADKAGHHVAYGDVFDHPTPRLLAQFVGGAASENEVDTEIENFDYSGIDAILQHNNIDTFLKGERQQLGHVLLTGATGYLGIHVLRELIDSDATTITCLVRGKDQASAEHRLKNLMFYYFERSFKELFGSRLLVVNGDVTGDMTGILPDGHPAIQTVFNCAANVKHFSKGTDIEDVNIGGAQRCVEFCLKTGARLVHISTTSVGEVWIVRNDGEQVPMLDERKLWFGQFLDNRYIHSKFLAERVVLDAVAHHGLSGKVMRVGNLAPRSYDGEFQANFNSNSYMGRLKVFHTLGCCPYDGYDEYTEMSPINETAKAVVLLASTPKECNVFQPFNNHTELLGDVLLLMEKVGREMRFVEADEFQQAIVVAGQDPEKAKLLSAMLAYQDMAHGKKAAIIERDNRYTCSVLHRLGFHWSDTSSEYIVQMLRQIAAFGFFEV